MENKVFYAQVLVFILFRQLNPRTKPLVMSQEPVNKSTFLQNRDQKERRLSTF